jgi:hypothetical protein
VWSARPAVAALTPQTGGRPYTTLRLALEAPGVATVSAIVAAGPEEQGPRRTVAAGEKGLRPDDWAQGRVVARRSLVAPPDIAPSLSAASVDTPLRPLACVAAARWRVEQCIEESTGAVGWDDDEVC